MPQARSCALRDCRATAAAGEMSIGDRAGRTCRSRKQQRTAVLLTYVRNKPAAMLVGKLERHRQMRRAQRRAVSCELSVGTARAGIERHRREATGLLEVVVDVVCIEGRIPGAKARSPAQSLLDLLHQRMEVAWIGLVERAGALGQHHLVAIRQTCDHDAGGIAPQDVNADLKATGGLGIGGWGRVVVVIIVWRTVGARLDAKFAVAVARGLARLVEPAFLYILLGIVFGDPGEDGLRIAGNRVAEGGLLVRREGRLQQLNGGAEQELERGIGQA